MCHRNLHKEIKTKTMVKPEFFTLHLMRVESDGKVLQDKKQYNLRGVNRGKLSKASLFKSFFSFGDRHSISYMRSYDMLQGEIRKSRTCHFSKSFILRQSTCQDAIFGDSMFWTPISVFVKNKCIQFKREGTYLYYGWFMLLYGRNQHNTL